MIQYLYQLSEYLPLQIIAIIFSVVAITIWWLIRVIKPKERVFKLNNERFDKSVQEIIDYSQSVNEEGLLSRIANSRGKKAG